MQVLHSWPIGVGPEEVLGVRPVAIVVRVMSAAKGRVVLLNGASSAGKTTVGQALQALLPDPWFLVPVDSVNAMRSREQTQALDEADLAQALARTRRGYHRVCAALASVGNDVIMDYPLSEDWRVDDLLEVLEGYDVALVELRCAPEELARRERIRGDRPLGLSAASQATVYSLGEFDVAIDTSTARPEACAMTIMGALSTIRPPKAFDRLRQRPAG